MGRYSLVFNGPPIKRGPNAVPVPVHQSIPSADLSHVYLVIRIIAVSFSVQRVCTNILGIDLRIDTETLPDIIRCRGKLPFFSTVSTSELQNASLRAGSLSLNDFVLIKA